MVKRIVPLFALLTAASAAHAAEPVGRVVALSGDVFRLRGGAARTTIERGEYVDQGDVVETGAGGNVRLLMRDKSVLALAPKSRITIDAYDVDAKVKSRKARLSIAFGRMWAFVSRTVHPDATYEVDTGTAIAGVRGTELVLDVSGDGAAAVTVVKGEVALAGGAESESTTVGTAQQGRVAGEGEVEISQASKESIHELKRSVQDAAELHGDAAARLAAIRARAGAGAKPDEQAGAVDRNEPGKGAAVFEDSTQPNAASGGQADFGEQHPADGGGGPGDDVGAEGLAPWLARVRVRVEVRQ